MKEEVDHMAKKAAKSRPAKKAPGSKPARPTALAVRVKSSAPPLSDRLRGRKVPHIGHLNRDELLEIIALAEWFRDHRYDETYARLLQGRVQGLVMVYESTRTRMGFETAMAQLGGHTAYLPASAMQLARGETLADTARALDPMIDVFSGRLWKQTDMETVAKVVSCPVLNACTPEDHTTHVIGELMTVRQAFGHLEGINLVYTGMARGIVHSFMRCCPLLGINLTVAIPPSYKLVPEILAEAQALAQKGGSRLVVSNDLKDAVKDADFIQQATLIRSMLAGEQSPEEKLVEVPKWTVTEEVLAAAPRHCLYSHSGPAHRNICASDAVMDGPRSLIPQEAKNAIYSKKAMLALMVK
jgi:ornithine carbamoyltransferase